jgi:hypothetical protein
VIVAYREERELVIRLHLSADFDASYEGDEDGYEWYRAFDQSVRPELVRELVRVLTSDGRYLVTPINRGLPANEELELKVEHLPR